MIFGRRAQQGGHAERKAMIDKKHDLPITRQAKALKLSRGSVYYLPRPVPAADLAIMRRMDELHLEFPCAGSRMLRDLLNAEGFETGRRHVVTLMKRMAIEAIYRKPNTSKPTPGHKIYPYLLRKLQIDRPNQVWATDITYIPMARGFVYLTAVVDWFSRRVLSWRVKPRKLFKQAEPALYFDLHEDFGFAPIVEMDETVALDLNGAVIRSWPKGDQPEIWWIKLFDADHVVLDLHG